MKDLFIAALVFIGFGLVVYGVYQISPAWGFIILGLGVGGYGFLNALVNVKEQNKKEK